MVDKRILRVEVVRNGILELPSSISDVTSITLTDYAIFNSSYNINDSNRFIFIEDRLIDIPEGNYTATELARALKDEIELRFEEGPTDTIIVYNSNLNKFGFNTTSRLWYFDRYPGFARLLGFSPEVTTIDITVSSNVVNLVSPYYYLIIKEIQTNDVNPYNCYTTIMNNVPRGSLLTRDASRSIIQPVRMTNTNLKTLTIELRDDKYNLVDMNGVPYLLEFTLTTGQ